MYHSERESVSVMRTVVDIVGCMNQTLEQHLYDLQQELNQVNSSIQETLTEIDQETM